jgi:acetylornithine deacetylase/succinyl-diaminopimelate desuccinylase-like protein
MSMTENINWKIATDETVKHLVRLIQTQTINPPGNELPAIKVLKAILDEEGFPQEAIKIVESAPKRVNLVARIKGDGTERPFLLSGHLDVVPVERDQWSHDPFGGEVIAGEVWGRGAIDMKGFLAMYLQTFLELYRHRMPLKRDVILAAIADEELGFIHGSNFLVDQHRELIDAEYGLTEAGGFTFYFGQRRVYPIQVAEKAVCWLKMRAYGSAGHGSVPVIDNPVIKLSEALEKIGRTRHLPVHISPIFLKMLYAGGEQLQFPLSTLVGLMRSPTLLNLSLNAVKGGAVNVLRALVTNTVSPNMLHAGTKLNVIPSVAEADIDCRLVPGQSPEDAVREIHHIVGDTIEVEVIYTTGGAEFPTETPLFKLLEKRTQQMDPGGIVIPLLMPGATDACQYQRAGIKMYGFTPGILPPGMSLLQLAHGHNERMPISFIESGLPVLSDVVYEFCGRGP